MSMYQTSNLICQSVNLTDDIKIGLEYDIHGGLLNIFVKNNFDHMEYPSQINILKNDEYHFNSSLIQQDLQDEINGVVYWEDDDNEPKICIELSNIYVYDLYDENENENDRDHDLCQTMIASPSSSLLSSSSSCFDEQTIDNDDGYSTHSLDDIEQQQQHSRQQSLSIPPSKFIIPFVPYQHRDDYSEEYIISSIPRLIEQVLWLNPFKKTVKQMIISHLFD